MVDARAPERWLWDRRFARLDDASYRSYFQALLWSVGNRTDGLIEPDDLVLIPYFAKGAVRVLVNSGLWTALDNGWLIADFMATQTSRSELEVLENVRGRERRQKAKQRAAKAAEKASAESDVPRDCTPGTSPGMAQARQGQARQGPEGDQKGYRSGHEANISEPCEMCGERDAQGRDWYPDLCKPCEDAKLAEAAAGFEERYR